jgi:hypothetical protein
LSPLINYHSKAKQTVTTFDNVWGFRKVATLQAIKSYGGEGAHPAVENSPLISALDKGEWSDSRSGHVTPMETTTRSDGK